MKKMICEIERRRSLCRLSGCLRPSQKQRKRRSLANNCCGPARQLEQIIARRIADAARRNGASGTSDMHGNAARVVESEPGGERMNLSRSAAIRFAGFEETAYWLELLVDAKIVRAETLSALRQECDELIAIFVTILRRSKETS